MFSQVGPGPWSALWEAKHLLAEGNEAIQSGHQE